MTPRRAHLDANGDTIAFMGGGGIFVLEDDDDLRLVLVELIRRGSGRECFGLRTLGELRQEREAVLRCALGIIDVNLGADEPSGLDAYAWLRAERFAGRIAFLTGHAATHPLVRRAAEMGELAVLAKPLEMRKLLELLS
jgi:FixJ family two-component response regulator